MTLIKSISGMRGTIGGVTEENLTPIDIVEFTSAYAALMIDQGRAAKVVIGRDGRISGKSVAGLTIETLIMMGIDVIDLGLSTTPTVEMEVVAQDAGGGIILTASHNPMEWNALKFLNDKGEFISAEEGHQILKAAASRDFKYAEVANLGNYKKIKDSIDRHVDKILDLETVDADTIRDKKFQVVVDCINSTGAISVPPLLEKLNCDFVLINGEISGAFAHNPEPLEKNLIDLSEAVVKHEADLGIAVDPDVDRLAFVDENGKYCGEEYTLVMIADWILSQTPGNTVSNLSSTIALRKITEKHGQLYAAAAVGEVNVVRKMKDTNAVIGGEGNGGIIYPELHAGRDALVGIALLLTALSKKDMRLSEYRATFPSYTITKNKIQLTVDMDVDQILKQVHDSFASNERDTQDGVKIYFDDGWAHLRKSNTEPIIRLYAEGPNEDIANEIAKKVSAVIPLSLN